MLAGQFHLTFIRAQEELNVGSFRTSRSLSLRPLHVRRQAKRERYRKHEFMVSRPGQV